MHNRLAALAAPWAILPTALQALQASLHRQLMQGIGGTPGDPPSANTDRRLMQVRQGVALIPVMGVLYRADDLDWQVKGYEVATYARIAIDVQTALDSGEVHALLLTIDSPGGQVSGMQECAEFIRAASARKPVWAHVDGMAASAAYGLACAAERIVASPSAMVGSLGTMMGMYDMSEMLKQMGITEYEFISSVSPHKNPDPGTPMGREDYQALVDTLGTVFIAHIAAMRAVTSADVLADYGQGRMIVGAEARTAGLIDALGTCEDTLAAMAALRSDPRRLRGTSPAAARALSPSMDAAMKTQTDPSAVTTDETPGADDTPSAPVAAAAPVRPSAAAMAPVLAADRTRVVTLLELGGVVLAEHITTAITDGTSAESFAVAALRAVRAEQTGKITALEDHSGALQGKLAPPQRPAAAASADAAEIDAILAHVPKESRA
jgi:capsid assembly protease